MDEVEALRKHARQEKIDAFMIAVATMLVVGLMLKFLEVNLMQLGIGAITGNVATTALSTYHQTSVINNPNNTVGTTPHP